MTAGVWPRHYGDQFVGGELAERGTIHGSGTIDIQVNAAGQVIAVWFRCLNLPFTVMEVEDSEVVQPRSFITAVEMLEGPDT